MKPRIMLISGSTRPESRSLGLLRLLGDRLDEAGAESHVWSLSEWPLPIMDPEVRASPERITDPVLRRFIHDAANADAFVLATPVYHDSYSGVLKNALDFLSTSALTGKVFGLVSHGGRQTTQPLSHLSAVVRALHSIQIPTQICTDDSHLLMDSAGRVVGPRDDALRERIDRFCAELIEFATLFHHMRRFRSADLAELALGGAGPPVATGRSVRVAVAP